MPRDCQPEFCSEFAESSSSVPLPYLFRVRLFIRCRNRKIAAMPYRLKPCSAVLTAIPATEVTPCLLKSVCSEEPASFFTAFLPPRSTHATSFGSWSLCHKNYVTQLPGKTLILRALKIPEFVTGAPPPAASPSVCREKGATAPNHLVIPKPGFP